jgi:hypothetical protein
MSLSNPIELVGNPAQWQAEQRDQNKQGSQGEAWPESHARILPDRWLSVAARFQAAEKPQRTEWRDEPKKVPATFFVPFFVLFCSPAAENST